MNYQLFLKRTVSKMFSKILGIIVCWLLIAQVGWSMSRRIEYNDGSVYKGGTIKGKPDGYGTYTWPDGQKYVGDFRDGERNGKGTMTWPSGDKYVGEWRNGKPHGQGTYDWPNGDKFVGRWENGNKTKDGTFTYGFWRRPSTAIGIIVIIGMIVFLVIYNLPGSEEKRVIKRQEKALSREFSSKLDALRNIEEIAEKAAETKHKLGQLNLKHRDDEVKLRQEKRTTLTGFTIYAKNTAKKSNSMKSEHKEQINEFIDDVFDELSTP